ncbi:MAG: hypothetical protein AAF138_00390 [Planctomycetota bacterium]
MSQITAGSMGSSGGSSSGGAPKIHDPKLAAHPALHAENITLPAGATEGLSRGFFAVGGLALLVTVAGYFAVGPGRAVGALHVGTMTALAAALGALFFTLIFHSVNAGFSATLRRQFENVFAAMPVPLAFAIVFLLAELIGGGYVMQWIGLEYGDDYLLDKKTPFLNEPFWVIRGLFYAGIWMFIITQLRLWSLRQDETGDWRLTRKARFLSGWGLLVMALTTAFASFDWLMAVDFRFFSTMWGVWYFSGGMTTSLSFVILILAALRLSGRLTDCVTKEHFHDLGKLLFGFTVFWAYISFSQYFLIWYSNIPEETIFFAVRLENGWENMFAFLAFGHFIAPFFILLIRNVKRSTAGLALISIWMILMQVMDMIYVIRPMTGDAEGGGGFMTIWLDIAGAAAVLCLFAGLIIRKVGASPLVAVNDPRMSEALRHKNYV